MIKLEEKELLNNAFVILESISWNTQTTVAQDKWKEARPYLLALNKRLKTKEQ